jgi:hypothetical protein
MTIVMLTQPVDLEADAGTAATRICEKKLDEFVKRENCLEQNLQTIYSLVWGQCTEAMRQRVEGLDTYREIKATGDGLPLLLAIKDLVFNFQSQKYLPLYRCMRMRASDPRRAHDRRSCCCLISGLLVTMLTMLLA